MVEKVRESIIWSWRSAFAAFGFTVVLLITVDIALAPELKTYQQFMAQIATPSAWSIFTRLLLGIAAFWALLGAYMLLIGYRAARSDEARARDGRRANHVLLLLESRQKMNTRQFLANVEANGLGWAGAGDWAKLGRIHRLLCRLADLRLAEFVGHSEWAISSEGREQASQMPYFWDGTNERDVAGVAGSAITRARQNRRIWWLNQ